MTSFADEEWDRLADEIPWSTAQQRIAYGRALDGSFGFLQASYCLFYRDGAPLAGLPLFRFAPVKPFVALYSLPFDMYGGPLIRPDSLNDTALKGAIRAHLEREAEAQGAFELCISTPPGHPENTLEQILGADSAAFEARACPVLDLTRPLEEIVAGYRPAVRRAVARSHRQGLDVRVQPPLEEVRRAFPLYQKRMKDLGVAAKPWPFVERLIESGLAVAVVASHDRRPAGLIILLVAGKIGIYWLAAVDRSSRGLRTPNGLMDRSIRWLHERGISIFSLGEGHAMGQGVFRFKMGWGPKVEQSMHARKVYRPKTQRLWRALEPSSRTAYAFWLTASGRMRSIAAGEAA